jgi:hypothetical protein
MNLAKSTAFLCLLNLIVFFPGTSFVKIKTISGKVIYIDPSGTHESEPADIVLITHEHSDHNDTSCIVRKPGCRVMRSADVLHDSTYRKITLGDITIQAVPAYDTTWHPKHRGVGYIVEFGGIKIYEAGGTTNIPEMAALAKEHITIALLPITAGPKNMTNAAAVIQAAHDIPIHIQAADDGSYDTLRLTKFLSPHRLILSPRSTISITAEPPPRGSIRYVPQQYPTIQSAIDASKNFDTVLVANGTYKENIRFKGKGIVVTSRFFITRNWETVAATIIDGSTSSNKDTASTVQFLDREDSTAVLDGFTVTGGTGTRYLFPFGTGKTKVQEGAGIILDYNITLLP